MKTIVALSLLIFFISCNSDKEENIFIKENWKVNGYIDSVQILLTNDYKIKDSPIFGASSFLIESQGDTLLCTAKHLLGEAMGIIPEIKTDSFNYFFKHWYAYPRQNNLSNDTISCISLINEEINEVDIILLKCKPNNYSNIQVLKPRFTKIKQGEKLEIIGCEYSDYECYQNKYSAIYDSYENGYIIIKSENKFETSGFSGAPVIDSNGYAVGVLSGGDVFEGELYLMIEPFSRLKTFMKKKLY